MIDHSRLTQKQQRILDFIKAEIKTRQRPPTVREIMKHFGYTSPNGVSCHINALTKKGAIEREYSASRGMKVLDMGDGIPFLTPELLKTIDRF